jgi:hypothetical protein
MFRRIFGAAKKASGVDLRWNTALRDLKIQVEPKELSRVRIEVRVVS